jgi:nicotinamidase-related amidase
MAPLTLLQHAGVAARPANWDNAVLVIIDAQNVYLDGPLPLFGIEAALLEVGKFLKAARDGGVPAIHIQHLDEPDGGFFAEGSHSAEIISAVAPIGGETVVAKSFPNAFAGTTLYETLKKIEAETGRNEVILVGFMTHMCISATARAAFDLGIRTTVVANAAATRDLPDPMGGAIAANTVHRTALAEIADLFATVVPDFAAVAKPPAKV